MSLQLQSKNVQRYELQHHQMEARYVGGTGNRKSSPSKLRIYCDHISFAEGMTGQNAQASSLQFQVGAALYFNPLNHPAVLLCVSPGALM